MGLASQMDHGIDLRQGLIGTDIPTDHLMAALKGPDEIGAYKTMATCDQNLHERDFFRRYSSIYSKGSVRRIFQTRVSCLRGSR